MAANIHLHQPRVEHALTEHDDNQGESATSDGQTTPQSDIITAPTDQQGNSAGDGGGSNTDAGTNESYTPALPPPEESIPLPAQFRYGLGDTVIMGRPDYVRSYADRAEPSAGKPSPRETAFAPAPRAENTPASAGTATIVKPIPMPKPGGNLSPAPALISSELAPAPEPAPTHNAPRIEGASVIVPPAPATVTATTPPATNLTFEQGMADLTLGDPLNQELIARYDQEHPGANLVEHGNATADHLVATYGEVRLNDMAKLHQALAGVRDDYTKALTAAEARGPSFDNTAFWKSSSGSSGDGGTEAPVFDNEAFTRWYVQQDGLSNRAFAANYAYGGVGTVTHSQGDNTVPLESTMLSGGTSVIVHERMETSSEGGTSVHVPRFAAPGLFILGGPACGIELHDPKAVWFDPTLGFVTSATNVVAKDDFMDRAMPIIMAVGFMAVTGLPATQFIEAGVITAGNTIAAGAINGAISSFVFTGASGGEITFKGIFQGALTGGIMGALSGLTQYQNLQSMGLDSAGNVTNYALRAVSITGQATVQGALRELVGGRFRDGFTQGLAQGLAGEITRALNGDVAGRLAREEITPAQARMLNQMTTMTGSAIRAAANPNDPAFAFAQDYLTQLLGTVNATTGSSEISPAMQAEMDDAALRFRVAVDDEDWGTQRDSINRLLATSRQLNPSQSNDDALRGVLQLLGTDKLPRMLAFDPSGRVRVMDLFVLPPIVVTNRQGPVETLIDDLFGDGTVDRINGGASGAGRSIFGIAEGIYDFARGGIDGWLNVINIVTGEPIFAESQGRMDRMGQSLNQALDNLPNLPAAIREHITSQFERANQLDAEGNYFEAAQIRSQLAGDIVQSIANPRSRSAGEVADVMRQIESRLTQAQQARRAFDYAESFFTANPSLRGQVVVHHSIELRVLDKYPGLFTAVELNGLSMLRGVPLALNNELHLRALRLDWNAFYLDYPPGVATRNDFLRFSRQLDERYGEFFTPPAKPPNKK